MSSYQFELAFRQYIAAFDGANDLSPAEFKSLFDNVHHKGLNYLPKDEKVIGGDGMMHLKAVTPVTREEIYQLHSKHYASGQKVTLIHFRKIGLDCVDIKVRLVNGKEETTVRVVNTLSNSQVVLSREIDESFPLLVLGAKCANVVYKWKEVGTYQTIM